MTNKKANLFLILLVLLILNISLVSALQISDVKSDVTDNTASISWITDEPADSFVRYGESKDNLITKGDSTQLSSHKFLISNLKSETTYFYSVESNSLVDDNNGEFYSFTTLAPDLTPPTLEVVIPSSNKGNKMALSGKTEANADVKIFVNDLQVDSVTAKIVGEEKDASFIFENIFLLANQHNNIRIESSDLSGNTASVEGITFTDTIKPKITISKIPDFIEDKSFTLKGTVSENSTIEIILSNSSVNEFTGTIIDQKINLNEGDNVLEVIATDLAGWESKETRTLNVDTEKPSVTFQFTKGNEYYEGRAETGIEGTTEPGAEVYLYVFRPSVDEYRLNFKKAIIKVVADSEGKFVFEEFEFSAFSLTTLKDLHPREVPTGLQEILIPKLDEISAAKRLQYRVYILAEDKTGKVGHATKTVYINSCSSPDFAFNVFSPPQFPPQPFKLNPQLMEEGRESIQAVYNITYNGGAIGKFDAEKNAYEQGYRIIDVRFQPACTKANAEKDDYSAGCRLIPSGSLNAQSVKPDKTMYYLSTKLLRASDFSEIDEDFWKDFEKRQLKIPLKILVTYQEREGNNAWSKSKTQVDCKDLGYFVDVPIESSALVPDFLANEGMAAVNYTIHQIERINSILEPVVFWTGVSCYSSWLTRAVFKVRRVVVSLYEPWTSRKKDDKCPTGNGQLDLYLDSTIAAWKKLIGNPNANLPVNFELKSLSKKCPDTAAAWESEQKLDTLYKAVCDRFFCRAVPARWTEDKDEAEVQKVILEQQQCVASSLCRYLTPVENCQTILEKNPQASELLRIKKEQKESSFTCWRDAEGTFFYRCTENDPNPSCAKDVTKLDNRGIWRLNPVLNPGQTKSKVLALKGDLNGPACVAEEKSCKNVCKAKSGFRAVSDGYRLDEKSGAYLTGGGCYKEEKSLSGLKLRSSVGKKVDASTFTAGYTKDCFVEENTGDKYQCACEKQDVPLKKSKSVRVALKKENEVVEEWSYRQSSIYRESGRNKGTYYPEWRYYGGRDFTAAFGLDHISDFVGDKKIARINPRDYVPAWQTMCLPRIQDQLTLLQNGLIQFRNCILAAKNSAIQDAGSCKTFFTNTVCSWIYSGISLLTNQCSPVTFDDVPELKDPTDGDATQLFKALRQGIPEGLKGSTSDLKDDYGAVAEQQFRVGSEGFTQSMCLFALGYDFPSNFDFLTDSAYGRPMKTSVLPLIANREFTSFDPIQGLPQFTYNLGMDIIPGCRLRGYRTSLKCIGVEDLGNKGIDQSCDGQGCDCLKASNQNTPFQGDKEKIIQSGSKFGSLTRLQPYDIPYKNPLQISSHFRYDHVKLELFLESGQDPKECFDEGYQTAQGGLFYFPLSHKAGKEFAQCQVDFATGRYLCPELSTLFQGGQSYLEHPFLRCYNKETEEFVDCKTPNLFVLNNEIVVKPYVRIGNDKACLKVTDNKGKNKQIVLLGEGYTGTVAPSLSLGRVTPDMISGGKVGTIVRRDTVSDAGCGGNGKELEIVAWPDEATSKSVNMPFFFEKQSNNKYQLRVGNNDVSVIPGGNSKKYDLNKNGYLSYGGDIDLTKSDIDAAVFTLGEFRFKKVLGNPEKSNGKCEYKTVPSTSSSKGNVGSLNVKVELLQPGAGDNCFTAINLVPKSSFGKNSHTQKIKLQLQKEEVAVAIGMHDDFMNDNYQLVQNKAEAIVKLKENNLDDASALYYWISSYVMQGKDNFRGEIISLLGRFFEPGFAEGGYPAYVTGTTEYKKIKKYLCLIDNDVDKRFQKYCGETSALTKCETLPQYEDFSCQDTKLSTFDQTKADKCVSLQCQDSILKKRGIKNPSDWKCCPK